jgi:DNA repair exonuclease SbcCD nuclease subunit
MKFIHAGDLHLGGTLKGIPVIPTWAEEQLAQSTMVAFEQLVQVAINEQVDFILLPGDTFDSDRPDAATQLHVLSALQKLNDAQIPVFISSGNHDDAIDLLTIRRLPYVFQFKEAVQSVRIKTKTGESVTVTGINFLNDTSGLLDAFPFKSAATDWHIGMLHGTVGQRSDTTYGGVALTSLQQTQLDYWALGHIHQRETLQDQPFIGYSGNIQGLTRKEAGPKGFYLVESFGKHLTPKFVAVAPFVWQTHALAFESSDIDTILAGLQGLLRTITDKRVLLSIRTTAPEKVDLTLSQAQSLLSQELLAAQIVLVDLTFERSLMGHQNTVLPENFSHAIDTSGNNLQQLGLGMIQDPDVLAYFMQLETQDELADQVAQKITELEFELDANNKN